MKNLNLILIALVSLLLTACSGGGSVASGSSGGGGTTPIDDSAPSAYKVIGMNKSEVSTFGTNVTLTFNTAPQLITSVMAGAYDCMYTHIGTTLIVTIPEELPGPTIELMVRDENGRQLQFEVDNELPVLPGLKVTTTVLPNFNDGPYFLDGANNRILRRGTSPNRLYWTDLDTNAETAYPVPLTNASQYMVNGMHYQYDSGVLYRYNPETGVKDPSFSLAEPGGIRAFTDDHFYIVREGINPGGITRIFRYNVSDGSPDTGFADNGVLEIMDEMNFEGEDLQFAVRELKIKTYESKIYLHLFGRWYHSDGVTGAGSSGPMLKILNEADGSEIATPDYFKDSLVRWQSDDNQPSLINPDTSTEFLSTPGLRIDQTGIYLLGGTVSTQRIRHSDLQIDDAFYVKTDLNELNATTDWRDVNYKVTENRLRVRTMGLNPASFPVNTAAAWNHPNIGWEPQVVRRNTVDLTPLDSGNYLLIRAERDTNSPAYNQICAYVIQPDGVPIRGHRNQKSCAHLSFDEDSGSVPWIRIVPTLDGEKFYRSGGRYTYILQTGNGSGPDGRLYRVDFDIVE